MKFISKNLASRLAGALLFAMAGSLVVSCSKDQDKNGLEQTGETKISVSIAGIDERPVVDASKKAAAAPQAAQKITSYGDFDVQVAYDNQIQSRSNKLKIKGSNAANGAGLKAAAIDANTKYSLYLYKDGAFVSATELVAGTPGEIAVEKGASYTWSAVSLNSETSVPAFDAANPVLAIPEGTDVLYASGELNVASDATTIALPITFKHQNSRIAIELNSMGMFGNMTAATVAVSGLATQTGDLNVVTGEWSNLQPGTQTIDFSDFENIDPAYGDAKVAYAYTVASETANTVGVSIAGLTVTHADGVDRVFPATPVAFDPIAVTAVNGSTHALIYNLVESPIVTGTGATAVRWARSNLYYEAGHNPYRFYANNVQTDATDGKGYFSFGGVIPRKFATEGGTQDPCALVYPAGVWRQPTHVDFAPIVSTDGLLTNVLGSVLNVLVRNPAPDVTAPTSDPYIDYTAAVEGGSGNPAFGPASNTLRFPLNGQMNTISVVPVIGADGLVVLNLNTPGLLGVLVNTHGRDAALWTNEQGLDILELAGLGSRAYLGGKRRAALGSFMGAQGTVEPLSNVDVLGLNAVKSTFKNVRCVRN